MRARSPKREMGAGIAASPHCAERWICRCSLAEPEGSPVRSWRTSSGVASREAVLPRGRPFLEHGANPLGDPYPVRLCRRFRSPLASTPAVPAVFGSVAPFCLAAFPARPTFRPGPAHCEPNHCFSSRGPSWDDRSFRCTSPPEDRPCLRHEEDQLFRRLLPALLRKSSAGTLPGDAFSDQFHSSACRR
jgi:hypothetical protein